jgi:hypothetical protein
MAIASHLKKNLLAMGVIGLLSALTYKLILPFVGMSLYDLLALSSKSFFNGSVWSVITYPFTISFNGSLGVYDVYQFAFDLALIAFLSHQILKKIKASHYYLFFYGSAAFVGLTLVALSYCFSFPFHITGPRIIFFALLMAWTELHNTNNFLFSRNVSTRSITLLTIGFTLLIDLANANWVDLGSVVLASLYSYLLAKYLLAKKPKQGPINVFLEDSLGNTIGASTKIHSIYEGKITPRILRWLRHFRRFFK